MNTTVIIFDDSKIFGNGIKLLIESHSTFRVIGEASNSKELSDILEIEKPGVMVVDLATSQNKNNFAVKKVMEKYPDISCVFLIGNNIHPEILESLDIGIHAVLKNENNPEQLIEAISTVALGESYINVPLSRLKSKIIQHAHDDHFGIHDFSELTQRELEVLKLFSEGCTYKEIGSRLFISPRTVESHKNNILNKLELNSVTDMVKYAIKHEIINL